jgi:phage terminase large subunit
MSSHQNQMPTINFKPSVKQDIAYQLLTDSTTNFIGYGGAAFGGKSYLLCYWATILCMAYPDVAIGIGRKELSTLKRTTLLTLFKVFAECNIKNERDYTYNQQLNTITFKNGSQIFLIDTARKPSDPLYTRLGGYELTACAVDESNETDELAIEILFTRCGRRNNDKYGLTAKMLETFNPDKGHVYRRYYKPAKENALKANYAFIQALPKDNPSPEVAKYIEGILSSSSTITKERLVYGNFEYDDDPSAMLSYDAIIDLFTNTIELDAATPKFMIVDVARYGSDKIVYSFWHGLKCYKIVWKAKQGVDETALDCREFAKEHQIPYSRCLIDEDGVGGGVLDINRGMKGFMGGSTPFLNRATGLPDNFLNLKTQCAYALAEVVNNHRMAVVSDDIEVRDWLIEDLEQIKTRDADKDGKLKIVAKEDGKERIGRSPDFGDVLIMRMYFEFYNHGTHNQVPQSIKNLTRINVQSPNGTITSYR